MAEMVSYGDRVYCVACCDSVSKILYLHFHIPGLVRVGVPFRNYKDDARSNKHNIARGVYFRTF